MGLGERRDREPLEVGAADVGRRSAAARGPHGLVGNAVGHERQLPEEQIQALTALLDKHATTTARLSRGDLVADR